jgi:iron complex transport system ATP-binding protein
MLEIKDIHFRHGGSEAETLCGVSFRLEPGEMTTLLGPNGSGKTTLFKCISGLWSKQSGSILCNGKDIVSLSPERRAKTLAVVPQEHEPPFPYSVLEAVLMGRASHVSLFSSPSREDYRKAKETMEIVGISHLSERPYTKISGGERQLALIARALAQEAPLLLLDEPTSHLDFRNQVLILKKIRAIVKQKGLTALVTLHDPNHAALFSDHIVMLNAGKVIADGPPSKIISRESLKELYGIDVDIIQYNGSSVICPRIREKETMPN